MSSRLFTIYKWSLFESIKSRRFLIVMVAYGLSIVMGMLAQGLGSFKTTFAQASLLLHAVYSSGMWVTFATVFGALILAVDAISGEREKRTLPLVLSQPITRAEFIMGKSLAIITALCLATITAHVILILAAISIFQLTPPPDILSASLYCAIPGLLFATTVSSLSILFSTLSRKTISALMATLVFVIAIGPILNVCAPLIASAIVGPPPERPVQPGYVVITNTSVNVSIPPIQPPESELVKEWKQWYSRYSAVRDAISAISPFYHAEQCFHIVAFGASSSIEVSSFTEGNSSTEVSIDFATIIDKTAPHLLALIVYLSLIHI